MTRVQTLASLIEGGAATDGLFAVSLQFEQSGDVPPVDGNPNSGGGNRSESEADGAQLGQVGQRSPLEHFEHLVLPFVST